MAKPPTRNPQVTQPAEPELKPAPDNGRPFGDRGPEKKDGAPGRKGRQVHVWMPAPIDERLRKCTEETGFSRTALLVQWVDEGLQRRGY